MRHSLPVLLVSLLVCLGTAGMAPSWGQTAPEQPERPGQGVSAGEADAPPSQVTVDQWSRELDLVEQQLRRADTTTESAGRFLEVTGSVRQEAQRLVEQLQPPINNLQRRLEALGPAPEEGQPAEASEG